ncbi:MAG: hypothetical protein HOM20_12400, partial [Porticoccaceae bacterium]|nr:hypothetical protein [Porticoccaceae bacterium]
DLQIYHDSLISYISDQGSGALRILASDVRIRNAADNEEIATFAQNGAVTLFYDNSEKIVTTSTGVQVTGTVVADGFSAGDDEKIKLGAGDDLQIYHNGTDSYISDTDTGSLILTGNRVIVKNAADNARMIDAIEGGAVKLLHNNSEKLETTLAGVTVTGALEVSAATNITVGGTALPSLTGLLGGSLSGTLGAVTMSYLPAAPSSPIQGQFYFNSLSSTAQIYTGSAFVDLVPSGGGGGGGGGSSTDANATFRKYTYSISSTTSSISGSSDLVTSAGSFVTGRKYTIKTVGTTDFTAIGASANTVGVVFDATGAGSGSGDAYDTLVYSTGDNKNVEVYVNGVKAVEGATNDYVATSGTSVNFVANLASGDVVDIQVYELLTNDAFVLASGGTFSGNVGINTSTINNRLHIHSNANEQGILLTQSGDNYSAIISDANRLTGDKYLLNIEGKWDGTKVARISFETGGDTTNKDDGRIKFFTAAAGTPSVVMRIEPDGNVGIGGDHEPTAPLHIKVDTASLLKLERNSTANAVIRYENSTSHMYAGLSSNATFFGIGPSENVGSSSTQLVVMRATGNVGIGNTNPESILEVRRNSSTAYDPTDDDAQRDIGATISIKNDDGTTNSFAQLTFDTAGTNQSIARIVAVRTGTSSNDLAFVTEGGNTKAERLRITSAGKVGIGTNDPDTSLHITDAVSSPMITLENPNNNTAVRATYIRHKFDDGFGGEILCLRPSGAAATGAEISFRVGGLNAANEKMIIKSDGNVGIGSNDPTSELDVFSSTFSDITISSARTSGNIGGFNFRKGVGGSSPTSMGQAYVTTAGEYIITAGGTGSSNEAIRIKADGNVGIGTDNPSTPLHVQGTAKASSLHTDSYSTWRQINTTGAPGTTGFAVNADPAGGTTLSTDYHYRVRLVTGNTGTNSSSCYLVWYNASAIWEAKAVSQNGNSSNHPLLRINSSTMEAFTNHANSYPIDVTVERYYHGEDDATLHSMGADFGWRRYQNTLIADHGGVGVGIGNVGNGPVDALLHVQHTAQDDPFIVVNRYNDTSVHPEFRPIFAVSEKDLSGGTSGQTIIGNHNRDMHLGALFNANGTVGMGQHGLTIAATGNVGIGKTNPAQALDVEGNIQINGGVLTSLLTASIADDAYLDVVMPVKGGIIAITSFTTYDTYPQHNGTGLIYYDAGTSRTASVMVDASNTLAVSTDTSTTVGTFTDGKTTIAMVNSTGTIRIWNRMNSIRQYKITLL